ncbi:hypothetical protein SCUCBS95973_008278 [Sporothrix curviconia]|uniref:Mitochondrial K+-H+ exchange-related-domain-containing protein n=1 Tax=Sporothrix curviconia TaxID=1260050 RepID=A0ABP0CK80_9PEZI
MRLFLLPISTRRTLLYCERLGELPAHQLSLMDKAQNRAAKMWSDWEKKPPGSIQHRIVSSGNAGLRRITFEEWGLKSVPPLSTRRRAEEAAATAANEGGKDGKDSKEAEAGREIEKSLETTAKSDMEPSKPVEVFYPASALPPDAVAGVLTRLATEREALHRRRLIWCFVGMPISAPFGLVPVIPNIPFFYLAYRAWSHWRALSGGKHIQYLLEKENGLVYTPSPILDAIYAKEKAVLEGNSLATAPVREGEAGAAQEEGVEKLLLSNPGGGKAVADAFQSSALELELERAIWQVETALAKQHNELKKTQAEPQPEPQSTREEKQLPGPGQPPAKPPAKSKDISE